MKKGAEAPLKVTVSAIDHWKVSPQAASLTEAVQKWSRSLFLFWLPTLLHIRKAQKQLYACFCWYCGSEFVLMPTCNFQDDSRHRYLPCRS
jgi:hypothetical protein